jgi:uncharacterized lipoprotein YajG
MSLAIRALFIVAATLLVAGCAARTVIVAPGPGVCPPGYHLGPQGYHCWPNG